MDSIQKRLETFSSWPPGAAVMPRALAEAGFYYSGNSDEVTCFSCKYQLAQWVSGDDPVQEHKKHNPDCLFMTDHQERGGEFPALAPLLAGGTETDSVMIKGPDFHTNAVIADDTKNLNMERPNKKPNFEHYKEPNFEMAVEKTGQLHLGMADFGILNERLNTFKTWRQAAPDPRELAKAGFVYKGEGDTVQCIKCDTWLEDIGGDMQLVLQHTKGETCKANTKVKQQPVQHTEKAESDPSLSNMGPRLDVRAPESNISDGSLKTKSPPSENLNPAAPSRITSKIPPCNAVLGCEKPRDTLFEPCGHFICCSQCADNCQLCPACK